MSQYVFEHHLTPRGRVIVHIYQGTDLLGVSRRSYETGEEAHTDIKKAMNENRLDQAVRYANGDSHGDQ